MRRREFVGLACGAAAIGWPLSARAQTSAKTYRIAMVHPNRPTTELVANSPIPSYREFFLELRRLGYIEGKNLAVEPYSGGGKAATYGELAETIVRSNPDLIFAGGGMVSYLKATTQKIPIVSFVSGDVVRTGLVASLARPGGNITGAAVDAGAEIWGKRFELLRQAIPGLSKVGFIVVRQDTVSAEKVRQVTREAGVTLIAPSVDASLKETEYKRVLALMQEQGAEAIMVSDDGQNNANLPLIVEQIAHTRLPAIYPLREAADVGGLMAYAIDFNELFRVMAGQIDQIFKGRTPAEIPIYLPTKFELVINLKTAKALSLSLPPLLVIGADEVIE